MKQPLVLVAVLYGTGIILGHFLEAPLLPSIIVALVIACIALAVNAWRSVLLPMALFLFGWSNMSSRVAVISPWDLRTTWQEPATIATIQANILDVPSERVSFRRTSNSSHTLAELEVTAVRGRSGVWQPAFGRVMSRTAGVLPPGFESGRSVEVSGVVMQPPGPFARGMFDYKRHLNLRGIHYELKVDSARDWKALGDRIGVSLANRFRAWAQRTLARGLPEEDEALRLQWAMLLGWKTALTSEVSEPFMRSGTMHIFAISGLHIAMIAGICIALLRAVALPQMLCGLFVIPIIWFYTAATGWQASAIRATVMMTVIIMGWALRRPTNLINSLATAACLILVWQPEQLFQAGFQLSFFVVLSIALLSPMIEKVKQRLFALDPMLPDKLRPRWQRIAIKGAGMAWASFAVSLAAFLGSVPLIAHYFHLFTPGSLVANLLIVPVSSLALMSGIGAITTGDLIPVLTECFNHSAWFWMRSMIWLSETAADLPAAWCHVSPPGTLLFCLYYGLLLLACSGWFARPLVRWVGGGSIFALLLLIMVKVHEERQWHRVTVLPFNGSHAVYIEPAAGGEAWLINCGDPGSVDFALKPFLQSRGADCIPHLLLTHGNARSISGALLLHETFSVRQAHASPIAFRSPRYRDVLAGFKTSSSLKLCMTNGFTSPPWTILHPQGSDRFTSANDHGVVVLGNFDGVRVLVLPPLGREGQNAMFTRHPHLGADIVIADWPQGGELAPEWLESIQPKLLLIAGLNSSSTRQRTIAQRLNRICSTVLVRTEAGAITLSLRKGTWRLETARLSELAPKPEKLDPDVQDE